MALPSSGVIKFSNINVELGVAANTTRKLSDSAVRTLFGVASGKMALSNGYGKANRVSVTVTVAANTTNYTLGTAQIPGYVAGKTDVTFVVNSGVYVYSTNTANAGLTVAALNAADTVAIVNNGFILGKGGNGGTYTNTGAYVPPTAGGPAISISRPVYISNNSYIAGGGGGGGSLGGGGAGGGLGGTDGTSTIQPNMTPGGAVGSAGTNGSHLVSYSPNYTSGGGGGRILPGVGGTGATITFSQNLLSQGGGAGGGGGAMSGMASCIGGTGGSGSDTGGAGWIESPFYVGAGGGGGGWGAAGGAGYEAADTGSATTFPGAAGGKAVNLNGNTVTWIATGTRYGVIS